MVSQGGSRWQSDLLDTAQEGDLFAGSGEAITELELAEKSTQHQADGAQSQARAIPCTGSTCISQSKSCKQYPRSKLASTQ